MVDSVNIESHFINHMTWWVFRQKCLTGFHIDVLNCSLNGNRFLVNLYKVLTEYTVINNTHARIALTLSLGVLLPLRKTENLSTPAASWDTVIPPRALPGTSAVFNKLLVWVIYCVTVIHLVELFTGTAPHWNSVLVSALRISVFVYQIA